MRRMDGVVRSGLWAVTLLAAALALPASGDPPVSAGGDAGTEIAEPSEIESKLKLKISKRESKHFKLYTFVDAEAAKELMKLAEQTYSEFMALMEMPANTVMFSEKVEIIMFREPRNHQQWVQQLSGYTGQKLDQAMKVSGDISYSNNRWEAWQGQFSERWPKDVVVHHTVHMLTGKYSGLASSQMKGWMYEAMAYWFSLRLSGTCEQYCVTQAKEGASVMKALKGGVADWKKTVKEQVAQKKDPKMEAMLQSGLNEMSEREMMKGWSVIDWMAVEKKKQLAAFFKAIRPNKAKLDLNALMVEHFGSCDELQKDWASWVLKNY